VGTTIGTIGSAGLGTTGLGPATFTIAGDGDGGDGDDDAATLLALQVPTAPTHTCALSNGKIVERPLSLFR
jgi:hypothetical protein